MKIKDNETRVNSDTYLTKGYMVRLKDGTMIDGYDHYSADHLWRHHQVASVSRPDTNVLLTPKAQRDGVIYLTDEVPLNQIQNLSEHSY